MDAFAVWIFLLVLVVISIILILFVTIKEEVYDKPRRELQNAKSEIQSIEKEKNELKKEIDSITELLNVTEQRNKNLNEIVFQEKIEKCEIESQIREEKDDYEKKSEELRRAIEELRRAKKEEEIKVKHKNDLIQRLVKQQTDFEVEYSKLKEKLDQSIFFSEQAKSNIKAIPYMAAIIADFETCGLEKLARRLDWGTDQQRLKKVKAIREIRKDAQAMVNKNKIAQYQLEYLLNLFPNLRDVIDSEYSQLPMIEVSEISNYDSARDYLSKEEYLSLTPCERNQLALDRYREGHNKSKWQIGRDYELYIGYRMEKEGFSVDYFGSYMGMEDLGRDIIAKKGKTTIIIQCKYWSSKKEIHENHINQLYGTVASYCIENNEDSNNVKGCLVTNIELSKMAKKMANYLRVGFAENVPLGVYPSIKCNIGHGEDGEQTKIYHLPFDQQYDSTKIDSPGEFMALTVAEAEAAGFRRAFKWFGS